MVSIVNATTDDTDYNICPVEGREGTAEQVLETPEGMTTGSKEELYCFVPNCPQKISTQSLCDILAKQNSATTLTLRVYDGYDSKRIQKTLSKLSNGQPWQEDGETVGTQYAGLEAVVINPTDGYFRDEFGEEVWDDGTIVATLPEPKTARERSADARTKVHWGSEASEFFVDFYDENNQLVSTKTYYVLSGDDENLPGDTLPPVVRDPVKEIPQPQPTTAPTNTESATNEDLEDTEDKTTESQNTEDQQGTVQTSTQTTEPQTVSSTDTTPTPLFYYFPIQDSVLACYSMETTNVPTNSDPLFYYMPDQQAMMQCYSIAAV
ncbi:MAG: hypothetical protein F4X82_03515 [Candidatus Spechtbacteria bacterium SB0662_bin_43]|uniref:Uncharacterized protein n=1 Tax=Candidatus Spechtbacteria bacterium SB0662_bin_43 TaxID=2604897 RepID=A0A845DK52_9BACT|nr:hypothetical protein [Candidatus Spechtbacteria bacterium SB0662_bin_43]